MIDRISAAAIALAITGITVLAISTGAEPIVKWWYSLSTSEMMIYQAGCTIAALVSIIFAVRKNTKRTCDDPE